MNIEISKVEFGLLLEYFYLGYTIACFENEEYDDKSNALLKKLLESGYKKDQPEVAFNMSFKDCTISDESRQLWDKRLNSKIRKMFIGYLSETLARRDLIKQYGKEEIESFDGTRHFEQNEELVDFYRNEFENNEFENIIIDDN